MFALQFVFTIVFVPLPLPCRLSMQTEEQKEGSPGKEASA